jgi:hypothetical protein
MKILTKLIMAVAASVSILSACTDTKKQEKDALNEVIKVHDEAMAKSEEAIKNKMLLDSLTKVSALKDTTKATVVINNLSTADKAMEDWMHQFNADYTGKAHEEIMQYLADQKKKVVQVNNHLSAVVSQSNQFLATQKK